LRRKRDRPFDVLCLGCVVAATKQHDENPAAARQINPVSRPYVDPKLAHAAPDRSDIAEIAELQALDPRGYRSLGSLIAQARGPIRELRQLATLDRDPMYLMRYIGSTLVPQLGCSLCFRTRDRREHEEQKSWRGTGGETKHRWRITLKRTSQIGKC
jgi:hypothetical protein